MPIEQDGERKTQVSDSEEILINLLFAQQKKEQLRDSTIEILRKSNPQLLSFAQSRLKEIREKYGPSQAEIYFHGFLTAYIYSLSIQTETENKDPHTFTIEEIEQAKKKLKDFDLKKAKMQEMISNNSNKYANSTFSDAVGYPFNALAEIILEENTISPNYERSLFTQPIADTFQQAEDERLSTLEANVHLSQSLNEGILTVFYLFQPPQNSSPELPS